MSQNLIFLLGVKMLNYFKKHYCIHILLLIFSFSIMPFSTWSLPKDFILSCKSASIDDISEQCGNIIAKEQDDSELAKAYSILALSYFLQGTDDSKEECAGIIDLLPGDPEYKNSKIFIELLVGQTSPDKLSGMATTADWQVAFSLASYLNELTNNSDPGALSNYYKTFMKNVKTLPSGTWIKAWAPRMIKWQQWLQRKKGSKEELDALIASFPAGSKAVVHTKKAQLNNNKAITKASANTIALKDISSILKTYLTGNIQKAKIEADNIKKSSNKNDRLYILADFLSGNSSITDDEITKVCQSHAMDWTLATIVMFIKYIADNDNLDKYKLYFYLDNFDGNYKLLSDKHELAFWKTKSEQWRKWVDSAFSKNALPDPDKLLIQKSSASATPSAVNTQDNNVDAAPVSLNLDEIDLETFAAERDEKYASRPRPADLEFDDKILDKYLSSLDPQTAAKEKKRINAVKEVKHYIIIVLEHTPYDKGLLVKGKKKKKGKAKPRHIKGVVYLANIHHLRIKKSKRSKKGKNYNWDDLAFQQYINFIDFFAERRLKMKGTSFTKTEDFAEDAAKDYYALVAMCDWYGHYEEAITYAKKCIEAKPEFANKIKKLLLD